METKLKRRWYSLVWSIVTWLILAGLLITACGVVAIRYVDVIPPDAMTHAAITGTKDRLGIYLQREHKLADRLDVLPPRQGYLNRTTDGWGRPLSYVATDDGFSLGSLGKDGVPGGSGDDADVIATYRIVGDELKVAMP